MAETSWTNWEWNHDLTLSDGGWIIESEGDEGIIVNELPPIDDPRKKLNVGAAQGWVYDGEFGTGDLFRWNAPYGIRRRTPAEDDEPEDETESEFAEGFDFAWVGRPGGVVVFYPPPPVGDSSPTTIYPTVALQRRLPTDDPDHPKRLQFNASLADALVPCVAIGSTPGPFGGVETDIFTATVAVTVEDEWDYELTPLEMIGAFTPHPYYFADFDVPLAYPHARDLWDLCAIIWRAKSIKLSMAVTGRSRLIYIPQ